MAVRTESAAETEAVGAELARDLRPGDVVFVSGELGAGKTTLIRGACRELGVVEQVRSPTFVIGHRYAGDVPVAHLDLYRLEALEGEEPALLDDYLTPDAVGFVEWPAVAGPVLDRSDPNRVRIAARVELRHAGGDRRHLEIVR